MWRSDSFRVWLLEQGQTEPTYQSEVYCYLWDHNGPTLYGNMPVCEFLRHKRFDRIELHRGECGNPTEYNADRIEFVCNYPVIIGWWVSPLSAMSPNDIAFSRIYVEFGAGWSEDETSDHY